MQTNICAVFAINYIYSYQFGGVTNTTDSNTWNNLVFSCAFSIL